MRSGSEQRAGFAGPAEEDSGRAEQAHMVRRLDSVRAARPTDRDELPPDVAFLARQGIPAEKLRGAVQQALNNRTAPSHELLSSGFGTTRYWSLLAADLGVSFIHDLESARTIRNAGLLATEAVRLAASVLVKVDKTVVLVLAPQPHEIPLLRQHLDNAPALAVRIRIATPETIRAFLVKHRRGALMHYAVNRLPRVMPRLSARGLGRSSGATGPKALLAAAIALGLLAPASTWNAVALLCTLFFFNCSAWKLAAALKRARQSRVEPVFERQLPTYTVLVPLYREAAVVDDLAAHLGKIDYPALCIKGTNA